MASMAVVVVNLNTRERLRACLRTVVPERPTEVVVTDNGSTDGSVEMVRAEYPGVRVQVNPENPGYGTAANRAIATCRTPYVLLLNSDTELHPGTLDRLCDYLERHPRVAILGPRLLNPDGTLQRSCYPFPGTLEWLLDKGVPDWVTARTPGLRHLPLQAWAHGEARRVPFVKGAALAIRRSAFDLVGGFDESFFMYAEEVDLCYRLGTAGWEVHFAPVAQIAHVGRASTNQRRTTMTVEHGLADLRFFRRHYSRRRSAALTVVFKGIMLKRLLRDSARLRFAPRAAGGAEDVAAWKRLLLGR